MAEGFRTKISNICDFTDIEDELIKLISESVFTVGVDDILEKAKTLKISRRLSRIADLFLGLVFEISLVKCNKELGIDLSLLPPNSNLSIYGLGKLGGREIIYSSDLDIIFVFKGEGIIQTGKGEMTLQEYFTKIAQTILETTKKESMKGISFEIDTRLRPSGTSGPLVQDINSYRNYFASQVKVWEKQAFTRLRFICGMEGPISEFEETIRDSIYDKSLSRKEAMEINSMRERMEKEIAGGKKQYFHVKFGEGGIVDIEFIAQALLLKYGKDNPALRGNNTLGALKKLKGADVIEKKDYRDLASALVFLRTIENRIRILENRPLNIFYKKPEKIVKLALRAGYREKDDKSPAEQLLSEYEERTETVRRIYSKYFSLLTEN